MGNEPENGRGGGGCGAGRGHDVSGNGSGSGGAEAAAVTGVPCSTPALVSAVSKASDGATLSLAKKCAYVLTAALPTVTQDLTINGNGATLRRSAAAGTAAFTILTITAGTVTLNLLNFTNGEGAITVDNLAELTVTGGVFSRNTAADGAAIDNTGSTVVQVKGASFINNTATGNGGAMYVSTARADLITDCRFMRNTAAGSGGAYWESSNGTTISGSTFQGNKATTGGALFVDDQGSLVTGTMVRDNSATGDGGGIFDSPGGTPVAISRQQDYREPRGPGRRRPLRGIGRFAGVNNQYHHHGQQRGRRRRHQRRQRHPRPSTPTIPLMVIVPVAPAAASTPTAAASPLPRPPFPVIGPAVTAAVSTTA